MPFGSKMPQEEIARQRRPGQDGASSAVRDLQSRKSNDIEGRLRSLIASRRALDAYDPGPMPEMQVSMDDMPEAPVDFSAPAFPELGDAMKAGTPADMAPPNKNLRPFIGQRFGRG